MQKKRPPHYVTLYHSSSIRTARFSTSTQRPPSYAMTAHPHSKLRLPAPASLSTGEYQVSLNHPGAFRVFACNPTQSYTRELLYVLARRCIPLAGRVGWNYLQMDHAFCCPPDCNSAPPLGFSVAYRGGICGDGGKHSSQRDSFPSPPLPPAPNGCTLWGEGFWFVQL